MGRHKKVQNNSSDSEQESHSERSRSRQRERSHQNQSQQESNQQGYEEGSQESVINSESIATQIRTAFLDFFGSVKHEKGFVFTPQERTKMQKQQARNSRKQNKIPIIDWKAECEWEDEEQRQRVHEIFRKEALNLSMEELTTLKQIFHKSSYLFGNESTSEVFLLLMAILKIALHHPNQSPESANAIKRFMAEMRADDKAYKFFNYKFSSYHKLPDDSSINIDKVYFTLGTDIFRCMQKALIK